jgi:hypothetical protein
MLKSLTFKTLALLLVLLGGGNLVAMAQNDYSAVFTSDVELSTTGGTSASKCSVAIGESNYDGIKAGTSSAAGAMKITVPSGTKYLHLHTAAWNGETVTLTVTPTGYSEDIALTANSGIKGNSPFIFNGDATTDDYYKVIAFSNALSADVELTFTATSGKRFVVWGVNAEEDGSTPPPPATYTVTYDCNGGTSGCPSNVTGVEKGTKITLADAPTKDDFTFGGWSDGTDTYDAGDDYTVNSNVTFTAQWTESGDYSWVKTNLADLTADDVFVIVGNNGDNYAMSNDKGTSAAPAAVAVTIVNDALTGTVDNNIRWTLSIDDEGNYAFYPNGDTEKWLYCTNSNNGLKVGTGENTTFIIKDDYLYNVGQGRYIGIYNSQDWRSYKLSNNGDFPSNIAGQTFAFYKKVASGEIPPSINADNVEIAYDVTSGSIAYTINNPVAGGVLTAACAESWITFGNATAGAVPFTVTKNEDPADRSASVTLTYTYDSKTVTKTVTVTQKGNPDVVMTIAAARAQATGSVVNTQGIITSFTVNNSGKTTAYMQDETAAIAVFGEFDAAIGQEIKAKGTLSLYKGLLQITEPTVEMISEGNVINPEVMTIAQVNSSDKQAWLVKIEEATVTNIVTDTNGSSVTIAQGENTVAVRFGKADDINFEVGDVLTLTGNIGSYNNSVQIANPTNVVVEENAQPIFTLEPTTIEVPAEGAEGTITVTKVNLDGEGISIEGGDDWVELKVNDENIDYTVEANGTTEERTATFIVTCGDAEPVTVTITQAAGEEQVAENTDVLTRAKTGVEGTSYKDWKDVTCNTDAVYAGNSAGGNDAIQLRTNNNNSGIITTASGGDVKSVTVVWNASTSDGRTLDIYGKASAYESAADLYDNSKQGVLLGSIAYGDDQPTTLTIDGSYQFIGLRSKSGAMYLDKITIVWDTEAVPQPSISVNPETIEVPAEGGEGTITMTTANLGDESLTITGGDAWATLVQDGDDKLKYTVEANKGDERTTTFTITAGEATATFTITQAAYVAPTVATLPFEFNGGKADIEGTDGLTMEGLDSDYSATTNPTTKLKFNSTGDWVMLYFDGEPGLLFFDIKGNSFGTGTFTVQTSENGEDFADLATFGEDEIGGTTLLADQGFELGAGVRYVKWIYTEKSLGNVGIGNIRLLKPNAVEQFEVTDAGWATHVTSFPVEFTDEVAYVVTEVSATSVKYEKVSSVPAGTPILVKGEGTWDGTIIPSAEAPETNLLKASDGTVTGTGKIYALAVGSKGVGFYKVAAEAVIPAGKCYIEYEGDADPAREFITIGDDTTTGIFDVQLATAQQPIYDLQGRIVQRSTSNVQRNKGLYIQNGKKIVVR